MKRIVICLDGTWNQVRNPKRVTNVVRIAQAIRPCASDGHTQICYYNSGVGTGDAIDRVLGGVFGRGIRGNVKRAYAFLSLNYEPGDEIYIFGFSRGAYTARALAGLIGAAGVLKKERFELFDVAWSHYRTPPHKRSNAPAPPPEDTHAKANIRCVGVWDTVGSYGIPAGFGLGGLTRYLTSWQRGFHDTYFSEHIDIGLHALGIDERRRPFSPTFWTTPGANKSPMTPRLEQNVCEQVWFCGVHSNVGGGYPDAGLAQLPLLWMVARVIEQGATRFHSTLDFDIDYLRAGTKDASTLTGMLYRSAHGWPVSTLWPFIRPVRAADWKRCAQWDDSRGGDTPIDGRVHWSVKLRLRQKAPVDGKGLLDYDPKNLAGDNVVSFTTRTPTEDRLLSDDLLRRAEAAGILPGHEGVAAIL
jgi:uncharacterized protein (DUF2235 family)